jgi:hypothetical protein
MLSEKGVGILLRHFARFQNTCEDLGTTSIVDSVYLMSKNGPIVIDIPITSPVSDPQPRQGGWGHQN